MSNCIVLGRKQVVLLLLVLLQQQAYSFTIHNSLSRNKCEGSPPAALSSPAHLPVQSTFPSSIMSVTSCNNNINNLPKINKNSYCSSQSPLFALQSSRGDSHLNDNTDDDDLSSSLPTYGGLLGKLTGLSMTAIRKSIRTTTGLSLTATRTALRGLTGVSVNASLKTLFGIFPPWFRYFLQPFFILYYTPLMIIKYFIGSTKDAKKEALAAHEKIVEGWKDAIKAAEVAQDFWPLHVTDDGKIESLTPQSVPVTDIIVESLDIASTVRDSNKKKE